MGEHTAIPVATWEPDEEKALKRKIDIRIFPIMILLFILNFIDRNNFSNARLRGLEDDLNLTDIQYQTCLSITIVGYVSMQIPSNMFLNTISRPSWYFCSCVAIWGGICAATGAVQNFTGALLCRFFLGVVEASFYPGSIYFLSRWYTRREMQLRITLLNSGMLASSAFGGLIAAGILGNMEGVLNVRAWRWLFYIEGAITVAVACIAVFILPDYPGTTRWLSEKEKEIAEGRLLLDLGLVRGETNTGAGSISAKQGLLMAIKDIKVWLLGLTYHATIMGVAFVFYFPTITQALGYNRVTTLLLTAPPWVYSFFVALGVAWSADRSGERFFHYLIPALFSILGFIISATTKTTAPRYFAMFLMTTGYASGFVALAWTANTLAQPRAKKAAAIAIVNSMGNIGSIPGTYIWPAKYGPYYAKSFGAHIGVFSCACLFALILRYYLKAQNKKINREEEASGNVTTFRYVY
ncbi:major facilitator superfamily transporter [Pyrenochaeta sp. DS3sAY3a]|nr:major facilitator superfamily transporter [Pyrenochaeta sp. DS3sAY3a]